ncbi:MAG TPA: homoserine kinase [Candidatus Bathyarchaeota archaeon]|nr:homoserine kinase [Candidatus Bathyarchaeota archaeon]
MALSMVEAIAPATSANLGAGFDVFGVALDALFDRVLVEKIADKKVIEISVEGEGAEEIPRETERNTAGIVAKELLKFSGKEYGLRIKIHKGVKPGSGLGSSAASAAATAIAVNELLGLELNQIQLIEFAALGEIASAGAPHADNVSAAILGDFIVITSRKPLEVLKLKLPSNVKFALVIPEIKFNTSLARSVLPKKIDLSSMVYNVSRAATFIAGIALNNIEVMGRGMTDTVIEPARAHLIPGLNQVKKKALDAGAVGVTISGAGPSIIALVDSKKADAEKIALSMEEAFRELGVKSRSLCAKPGLGAKIIRKE